MIVLLFLVASFETGKLPYSVTVGAVQNSYRLMTFTAMPGEAVPMKITPADLAVTVVDEQGQALPTKNGTWTWPGRQQPGRYTLRVQPAQGDASVLHIFVLAPLQVDDKGMMHGYHLGHYPNTPLKGLSVYKKPKGLVKVNAEDTSLQLSPHFTLGQFLCKQKSEYPIYLIVRTELLLKLEYLLELVNKKGIETDGFAFISGFRTPYYNTLIGNVKYSRHQWGGAADIFIDRAPRDGQMDDLNRDGVVDVKDAAYLYELINKESHSDSFKKMIGGLGQYKKTATHGPFIHVDARGFRARWGH